MSNLKPCPFCGGKSEIRYASSFQNCPFVCCQDDFCSAGNEFADTDEQAIRAWNTRTKVSEQPDEQTLVSISYWLKRALEHWKDEKPDKNHNMGSNTHHCVNEANNMVNNAIHAARLPKREMSKQDD